MSFKTWLTPDQALTDSGLEGELTVARTRVFLLAAIFFIPVAGALSAERDLVDFIAVFGTGALAVVALAVWSYVRRGGTHSSLPFWTSIFDVTMISAIAAGYVMVGRGDLALNSPLVFPAYFLALAGTCLRYDMRICVVTGATAIIQYVVLVLVGMHRFPANSAELTDALGRLDWVTQIGRVVLLATFTVLSVAIVDRVRRLRLLSTHDGLTGLYNRAYFDERVAEELLRARRYNRPLTIGVLDLDYFKQVNDKYGHHAGDEVLRRFADTLRESFRRTDIVARYGGEEFAIALTETSAEEAEAKLNRMRQIVSSTPVDVGDGVQVHLTFSAGLAHYPLDGDATPDLVKRGDSNLLSAKRDGRNRVVGTRTSPNGERVVVVVGSGDSVEGA